MDMETEREIEEEIIQRKLVKEYLQENNFDQCDVCKLKYTEDCKLLGVKCNYIGRGLEKNFGKERYDFQIVQVRTPAIYRDMIFEEIGMGGGFGHLKRSVK